MRRGVALAAAALCFCFGQWSEFNDSSQFLVAMDLGGHDHHHHVAFAPLLRACYGVLAPLGVGPLRTGLAVSALSIGIATWFIHATAGLLFGARRSATLAACCFAAAPAVFFMGTVICPYAAMLAVASLATWLAAHASLPSRSRRLSLLFALGSGLASGIATRVHATGQLIPLVSCGLLFLASGWVEPRRAAIARLALGLAPLVAHVLFVVATVAAARASGGVAAAEGAGGFLVTGASGLGEAFWRAALVTIWRDGLVAFAPMVIVLVLAVGVRGRPRQLAVLTGGIASIGCAATLLLLHGGTVRGAYLIVAAIPAALFVAALWPAWVTVVGRRTSVLGPVLLVVVSIALAVRGVVVHDDRHSVREYSAGLVQASAGDEPALWVGMREDIEALFGPARGTEYLFLRDLLTLPPAVLASGLPQLDEWVRSRLSARRPVFITAAAWRMIESFAQLPGPSSAELLRRHVRTHYRTESVVERGFRATRVVGWIRTAAPDAPESERPR